MAKYIQNENYKKRNAKRSKSNINHNEKLNKFSNSFDCGPLDNEVSTTQKCNMDGINNIKTTNKTSESNVMLKGKGNFESKVKNNFTLRSYRKRPDSNSSSRRKRSNGVSTSVNIPVVNRLELEGDNSHSMNSNSEQYLEAGTYERQAVIRPQTAGEQIPSEDDDSHSMISDYSDFCQREQYNVDCYNYYLNFGDPYVMNNGEISASDSNWLYERQPNYRVFYYGNQINDGFEGHMRYNNFPNHQEFKYRNMDQTYPYCLPNDVYLNNYLANNYINGYMEPSIMPNEYYQFEIPHPQEFVPARYCKPVYEEPQEGYTANPAPQVNDTTDMINLNSSLFVYNSNVQLNTIQDAINGTNTTDTEETVDSADTDINNNTDSPTTNEKEALKES